MNKTVGILTFHRSRSYGACLQALATVRTLTELGYDAELIDYTNAYEQLRHKPKGVGLKRILKKIRWRLKSIAFRDEYWASKSFHDYEALYGGRISTKRYYSHAELQQASYDLLLSGSDQIWNPQITNGLDIAYMLAFGNAKRRIAYASSMGSAKLNMQEQELARKCLARYDAIGVREKYARNELSHLTCAQIDVVCDPTLLISASDWQQIIGNRSGYRITGLDKYAICFFVGGFNDENARQIQKIREKMGIKLCNLQMNKRPRSGFDRLIAGYDVLDFLALIRDAEYIVTDSFHGTVFSLLFGKMFAPLSNAGNPIRVRELLCQLKLEDRIDAPELIGQPIDYFNVSKRIQAIGTAGRTWLENALEHCKA